MATMLEENDKYLETVEKLYGASFREIFNVVNAPCGEALDLLWRDVVLRKHPDYGDWEYPGQAYRHLAKEFNDMRQEIETLNDIISALHN